MTKIKMYLTVALFVFTAAAAVILEEQLNFREWGWGRGCTVSNGIVTLTLMPSIGGRPVQYELEQSGFDFLYFDESKASSDSNVFPITYDGAWAGGMQTWPVPQDNWTLEWPPPPQISNGEYTVSILSESEDSVSVSLLSSVETGKTPGLRLKKIFTLFDNTSRVKIEHRLFNVNAQEEQWSLRLNVQCWHLNRFRNELGLQDADYRAYFPAGVSENDGETGYWDGWNFDVTKDDFSGIMSINFNQSYSTGGLRTHPSEQWLAMAENSSGKVFIQRAQYETGAVYPEYGVSDPDKGAVLIFYNAGNYYEAELCSPERRIAPGDSSRFFSDWYMTTIAGPVHHVNSAGAVKDTLFIDTLSETVTGKYGVFYRGVAKLMTGSGQVPAAEFEVSPDDSLVIDTVAAGISAIRSARLEMYDEKGNYRGVLDTWGDQSAADYKAGSPRLDVSGKLMRIKGKKIVSSRLCSNVQVNVYSVNGSMVANQKYVAGEMIYIDSMVFSPGIYFVFLRSGSRNETARIAVCR